MSEANTQAIIKTSDRSSTPSVGQQVGNGSPIVASLASTAFPGVGVDLGKVVPQTGAGQDGDVGAKVLYGRWGATGLVEVDLVRRSGRVLGPVLGCIRLRRCRRVGVRAVCKSSRDGRIVAGDKVAIDVHEGFDKVRGGDVGARTKVADNVVTVERRDDTVLVSVRGATRSRVGF